MSCHRVWPHLHVPQEDQYLRRACRTARRHQGGRRRHLDRKLHALRSRLHRLGTENPATTRQPVRGEVVTHVLGTTCYPCLKVAHFNLGGDAGIRTLDTGFGPYAPLAGECLRPLGHVSLVQRSILASAGVSRPPTLQPYTAAMNANGPAGPSLTLSHATRLSAGDAIL